jgi:hypothetical protein
MSGGEQKDTPLRRCSGVYSSFRYESNIKYPYFTAEQTRAYKRRTVVSGKRIPGAREVCQWHVGRVN